MECDTIKMNNVMVRSITHVTLKNVMSRRNQMLVGLQGRQSWLLTSKRHERPSCETGILCFWISVALTGEPQPARLTLVYFTLYKLYLN